MAGRCRSHRSIRTHLKTLETAITDPGGLATSLYQEGLIDNLAWQRAEIASAAVPERSRELLQKVMVKIGNDEAAFDKFVSILRKDPSMEDLSRIILETTPGTYLFLAIARSTENDDAFSHALRGGDS